MSEIRRSLGDRLAASHHVTLVIRLTGNPEGDLVHGEAVDAQGVWHCRFARWDALVHCVRERLKAAAGEPPGGGSLPPAAPS